MKKLLLFSIPILMLISSCEKTVQVDMPPYEPVLVVNSILDVDSALTVDVLHSRSILDSSRIKRITSAKVELYENDNYVGRMILDTNNAFTLPSFTPKSGNIYKIEVEQSGYKSVSAHTFTPQPVNILRHSVSGGAGKNEMNEPLAVLNLSINDPSDKNYYFFQLYKFVNDTFWIDTLSNQVFSWAERIPIYNQSTEHSSNLEIGYLTSDELFNGREYQFNLYFDEYELQDTSSSDLIAYVSSVSPEFYKFIISQNLQQLSTGNPFAEPVRIYSNINNGLGIFGASTTRKIIIH